MIVVNIGIGMFAGLVTFLSALILGVSFWPALLLYTLAGTLGLVIVPLMRLAIGTFEGRADLTSDTSSTAIQTDYSSGHPTADQEVFPTDIQPQPMRILAVDDDPYILELIPMISAKAGFSEVTSASSGELALDILAKTNTAFDCLLFDINMPEMDGIELCERVRSLSAYRHTPIIMLTAMRDMKNMDGAFRAGATDYTTKPFDIGDLGARLQFAQEAIIARQEASTTAKTGSVASMSSARRHAFDLDDEVPIEGVKNLVTSAALANYITQVPAKELTGIDVVAVKIDQIDEVYAKATSGEFIAGLKEVATAVGSSFTASGGLLAYTGNGLFLVISDIANRRSSSSIEADLQALLADKFFDGGHNSPMKISIGEPVAPNVAKAQRARITFDRAAVRAENRAIQKQFGTLPSIVHRRGA